LLTPKNLGLSIVHQLVQDLGGTVNIQSEVGYGTIADISVPSDPAPKFPEVEDRPLVRDIRARCKGLTLCLVAFNVLADLEPPTGILTPQQRRMIALNLSITTLVVDWFGMEVTAASTLSEAKGDFTIVLQSHIQQSDKSNGRCPLIVFEDGIKTSVQSDSGVFYLSQPYVHKVLFISLSLSINCLSTNTLGLKPHLADDVSIELAPTN
jgi:hypothetical protein